MVGGVPGSGKSHLLSRVRTSPTAFVLAADDVRARVQEAHGYDGDAYVEDCIEEAREEFFNELHNAFSAGESILVEAAYLTEHSRLEMIDWCNARAYTPHLIIVSATWSQCCEGNGTRNRRVPIGKLLNYWYQFTELERRLMAGQLDAGLASAVLIGRAEPYEEIVFAAER